MKGDPGLEDIKRLLAEILEEQKRSSRKSRKIRLTMQRRLDDMHNVIGDLQGAISEMQATTEKMQAGIASIAGLQASIAGFDHSTLSLRADVDQLQAAEDLQNKQLGRMARAMNTFVDGYGARATNLEARVEKLESA